MKLIQIRDLYDINSVYKHRLSVSISPDNFIMCDFLIDLYYTGWPACMTSQVSFHLVGKYLIGTCIYDSVNMQKKYV